MHELHFFSNPSIKWNSRGDSDETDVTEEIPETYGSTTGSPQGTCYVIIPFMGISSRLAWPASLDVPGLLEEGWRPSPFREFIVKVHSRCDLSCDYCYMYEMADQSWRDQPRAMSEQTADVTARRIGEHAS